MRSSMAPRMAEAMSTPIGSSIDSRPAVLKTRVIRTTDTAIITPPIVGVPVLTKCVSGPSTRTCLAALRMRRKVTIGRPMMSVTTNARPASASETAMF